MKALFNIFTNIIFTVKRCSALKSFIKYLGYESFQKSKPYTRRGTISVEVCASNDKKIFIYVFNDKGTLRGQKVVSNNDYEELSITTFKRNGFKWFEDKDYRKHNK